MKIIGGENLVGGRRQPLYTNYLHLKITAEVGVYKLEKQS